MTRYSLVVCLCAAILLILFSLPAAARGDSAEIRYYRADAAYNRLHSSRTKQKYRNNWLKCIEKYKAAYRYDPNGPWAAAGLFMSAKLQYELGVRSGLNSDLMKARDIFERIIRKYPKSRYCSRSRKELKIVSRRLAARGASPQRTAESRPKSAGSDSLGHLIQTNASSSPAPQAATSDKLTTVEDLRYWSNPHYTRVVIDADRETTFAHRRLKRDASNGKPQRLFIDLTHSRVGPKLQSFIPINDGLLISARAAQNTPDQVRVVVDIKSFQSYKVFSLRNPFRIVIDVWGENGDTGTASAVVRPAGKNATLGKSALARQLALGVRRIIIDPGHGGKDTGAPGYIKGVYEKNVTLAIAKKLAVKLRRETGCQVILTRTTDKYLSLEERTAIANTDNGDLFISIHANSSTDRRAYGIATYFLNLATDNEAIRVAARENATSTKNISDLESILKSLMRNAKVNESSRLADDVENSICGELRTEYSRIKRKGVKQAPFYVLLGAQMPAILVETSFISNPRECRRLESSAYQNAIAKSIADGVKEYIRQTNPTAFLASNPDRG